MEDVLHLFPMKFPHMVKIIVMSTSKYYYLCVLVELIGISKQWLKNNKNTL